MTLRKCSWLAAWPFLLLTALTGSGFDHAHTGYARLLERHSADSHVDYERLKTDSAELRAYLDEIAKVTETDFDGWSRSQQLAFLINLYNAATLQLVIDHYPIKSIREIGGIFGSPWKLSVVRLWGGVHSLDWLEHEIIRPRYGDARVHFALVCAAKGCPPLRREPYLAARLDAQLDDQGRTFLAQRDKNRFEARTRTLHLSLIFKWYRDDFIAQTNSLQAFVSRYFSEADSTALAEPKLRIVFTKYDWSLNDASKSR
jgi:Protein of unknown function, DUF547